MIKCETEKSKDTIKDIRKELQNDPSLEYIDALRRDERIGVQKLLSAYLNREKKRKAEQDRLSKMWDFEKECWREGLSFIAGVDEAGRGPLAGPVVAAAVILPHHFDVTGMNDSKQLNEEIRMELRERILRDARSVGVGMVDAEYIDAHNILQATFEAMRIALSKLDPPPDMVLVDALTIPKIKGKQKAIIKGDVKSHSIAAASIIAKTTRDEWMRKIAKCYPQYEFDRHMGYPTEKHLEAIHTYGPSAIHRVSFSPFSKKDERERMQAKSKV